MNTVQVVNIKCGGCRNSIIKAMEKEGFTEVEVNIEKQEVSFEGDVEKATAMLSKLGYPKADSDAAKSVTRKAKSFVSCALGKM